MRNGILLISVLLVLTAALAGLSFADTDSDARPTVTANVYAGEDGGILEMKGTGSTLREVLDSAFAKEGISVEYGPSTIKSFDGREAPEGSSWTVQQWLPPHGWTVINLSKNPEADLREGTSYYIHMSEVSKEDGRVSYSHPSYEPKATAYFFIQFREDNDVDYVKTILTEEQRREGFWISGYGSNIAYAFEDACADYGFELDMSDGYKGDTFNPDFIGWLNSFMTLVDVDMGGGSYKYWSQYPYDNGRWVFGQTMGHYDPAVIPCFALIRQITSSDSGGSGLTVGPDDVPYKEMANGCDVSFVDGDGNTVSSQNVPYYHGSAVPPETAAKSPSGNRTYEFVGWEGNYTNVLCDTVVKAKFKTVVGPEGIPAESVSIGSVPSVFEVGKEYILTAKVLPEDVTDGRVSWSSSDPSVASVDQAGKVRVLSPGTASVTASAGGVSDSVQVTAEEAKVPVSGVRIVQSGGSMYVGDTLVLEAVVMPDDATVRDVSWDSDRPDVLRVDSRGNVSAVSPGTAAVTVTTEDGGRTASVTFSVSERPSDVPSVPPVPVSKIEFTYSKDTMEVGEVIDFDARALPENADDRKLSWSSSDPSVATVDDSGTVEAKAVGKTRIAAKSHNGVSAEIELTVKEHEKAPEVHLTDIQSAVSVGSEFRFTADSADVRWSSSDLSVLSIGPDGTARGVSEGRATVTVASSDLTSSDSCMVTVVADFSSGILVDVTGGPSPQAVVSPEHVSALVSSGSGLTVMTDNGSVMLPSEVLKGYSSTGFTLAAELVSEGDLTDSQKAVIGGSDVYEFTITETEGADLGGMAEITIPYVLKDGEDASALCVYYMVGSVVKERIDCIHDASAGTLTFLTDHFSLYFPSAADIAVEGDGNVPEESGGEDTALYIGIAVVIAVVLLVALVMRARSR